MTGIAETKRGGSFGTEDLHQAARPGGEGSGVYLNYLFFVDADLQRRDDLDPAENKERVKVYTYQIGDGHQFEFRKRPAKLEDRALGSPGGLDKLDSPSLVT